MASPISIVIPAAGRSSRFPDMRPKWLLTHPSGKLMLELAVAPFLKTDARILLATTRDFCDKYEVPLILSQLFGERIELVILERQTQGPVETILLALELAGIKEGSIVLKDVDNYIAIPEGALESGNFVVGVDVNETAVERISNKSFISKDSNNIIQEIIEKRIISNYICVGVYGFSSASDFIAVAQKMLDNANANEIYVSHVIESLILDEKVFVYIPAVEYKDWGTITEWTKEMNQFQTFFCDFDGVIVVNKGKFGANNWFIHSDVVLEENIKLLKDLVARGGKLIITTARPKSEEDYIRGLLSSYQIDDVDIICGLPHARRVLINDYSNTNPYPSAIAINIERNGSLKALLNQNINPF